MELSYQSRLGPVKWLEPSTTKTVEALVKNGVKKLAIVAPAFLADGLEPLRNSTLVFARSSWNTAVRN